MMPHTSRSNYKAKWLNALAQSDSKELDRADNIVKLKHTLTNVHLENEALRKLILKLAENVQSLCLTIDDCREIGSVSAPKCEREVDESLLDHSVSVIVRRATEACAIAENRLGMLYAAYSEQVERGRQIDSALDGVKEMERALQRNMVEMYYVGRDATGAELEEAGSPRNAKRIERYGKVYEDRDIDEFLTYAVRESLDSEDSDSDDEGQLAATSPEPFKRPLRATAIRSAARSDNALNGI